MARARFREERAGVAGAGCEVIVRDLSLKGSRCICGMVRSASRTGPGRRRTVRTRRSWSGGTGRSPRSRSGARCRSGLVAAEGRVERHGAVHVDPHGAGSELAGHAVGAADVERPHAGGEPEGRAVGDRHRLFLVLERDDRQDRAEKPVLRDVAVGRDVGKDGGRRSSRRQAGRIGPLAAEDQLAPSATARAGPCPSRAAPSRRPAPSGSRHRAGRR